MAIPHDFRALVAQQWTPDRVQDELVREDRHWPRYELIDGELLVTPGPRPDHQRVVQQFFRLLDPYVAREGIGELMLSPSDVRLTPRDTTQPDVFVIPRDAGAGSRTWRDVTGLLLAVEVISPSSRRYDRVKKRFYYAARGVPDYWVADAEARTIERNGPDGLVTIHADRLVWQPAGAATPLVIDVVALYADALGPAPPDFDGPPLEDA